MQHYAALLRQAIRTAGLSISEVERQMGAVPKALQRIFSGQVDLKVKHIIAILHIVGLSEEQFFTMAFRREGLAPRPEVSLEALRGEFDELVQRLQTNEAKAAGKALFAASPHRLGQAALAATRRS